MPTIQSFALPGLPSGAPVTVQPSNSSPSASNDVVPSPVETTTSSTKTPCTGMMKSDATARATSTLWPAHADRSTTHRSHPSLEPLAAHHSPVVPVGSQRDPFADDVT